MATLYSLSISRFGSSASIAARIGVPLALLCGLVLALPGDALADSVRCDGRLIEVGDPKARLAAACGEPFSKDVVAVERVYADGRPVRIDYVEEWTYPAQNTLGYDLLRFEGGRLASPGIRCGEHLVEAGDTMAVVLQRCGAPRSRDSAGLLAESPGPAAPAPTSEVLLEQWVYDRGPGQLLSIVTLRGGRITAIEDGPRR
jgi:hypothetical protein